jgi:hypothetical protein
MDVEHDHRLSDKPSGCDTCEAKSATVTSSIPLSRNHAIYAYIKVLFAGLVSHHIKSFGLI